MTPQEAEAEQQLDALERRLESFVYLFVGRAQEMKARERRGETIPNSEREALRKMRDQLVAAFDYLLGPTVVPNRREVN